MLELTVILLDCKDTVFFSKSFKDEDNQRTLQQLVCEVKGLQPDFLTQQIHG